MPRPVPPEFEEQRKLWINISNHWYNINNCVGGASAGLSVIIAVNAKANFLPYGWMTTVLAATAAVLTFLLTTYHADKKGAAFTLASREVEAAMFRYRTDLSLPESFLGEAVARGIELLNKNGAV
jgi:hypothetical protein